jgi:hypothetical protein
MKNSYFWDMTLCNLVKVKRRFGGTYRLLLQGLSIFQASRQQVHFVSGGLQFFKATVLAGTRAYPTMITVFPWMKESKTD